MIDAVALAKALYSSDLTRSNRRPVADALTNYEAEMLARSNVKVLKSRSAAIYLHSEQALTVANITRASAAEGLTVE